MIQAFWATEIDMADEQEARQPTPPYIPYKTFKNFLAGLKPGIPSRIDRSVMNTYSGATQSQITQALRYFGMIDAAGHPTDKLGQMVHSDGAERQKQLKALATTGYPMIFSNDKFDISKATTAQLAEQFAKMASGETVRKCINFLLPLLKEAGVTVSPHIKGAPKRTNGTKTKKPKPAGAAPAAPAAATTATGVGNAAGTSTATATPVMGWKELLLSKFPSFDPGWPDEVKAKWFESFEKLMQSDKGAA
jgi:Family of unknown function (DUF5343)